MAALLLLLSLFFHWALGFYPRAHNVTWKSTNFKTILTWEPQPAAHYSYTVEFSAVGQDKQRIYHCIHSSVTMCDLSTSLTDLNACYTADVLTEPSIGARLDLIEFPHTTSLRFCPYKDTDLGRPDFKVKVSKDKKKTTLYVSDLLTAIFKEDRQLTVRDIYSDQLQYKVTYRKNKSTGKKVHISNSNVIELTGLDEGESYCFNVQAYIPSRSTDKQLGELSDTQCSKDDDPSIFKVYSVGVIACAILFILLLIGIIIAVTVVCCKHKKKALKSGKEGVPLQSV